MQIVCAFLSYNVLLRLMFLKKRFYISFLPPVFSPLAIYTPKLIRIFANTASIEVLSQTRLSWQRIQIHVWPAIDNSQSALDYFNGKRKDMLSQSKITQFSDFRMLFTGGYSLDSSLLPYKYEVGRSALIISLDTATVTEKPQMRDARVHQSVAVVGHFAYVIGGVNPLTLQPVTRVERYDILAERWATLPSKFDEFAE
jgi:hypothetical protein